jgi:CheY-like chemotaxis protein
MVVIGEAADGPEALRLAQTPQPAVALLDIALPHLNGLETAHRLRETVPQTNTHGGELCIIFLTAPSGEPVSTSFADACPVEMMQD